MAVTPKTRIFYGIVLVGAVIMCSIGFILFSIQEQYTNIVTLGSQWRGGIAGGYAMGSFKSEENSGGQGVLTPTPSGNACGQPTGAPTTAPVASPTTAPVAPPVAPPCQTTVLLTLINSTQYAAILIKVTQPVCTSFRFVFPPEAVLSENESARIVIKKSTNIIAPFYDGNANVIKADGKTYIDVNVVHGNGDYVAEITILPCRTLVYSRAPDASNTRVFTTDTAQSTCTSTKAIIRPRTPADAADMKACGTDLTFSFSGANYERNINDGSFKVNNLPTYIDKLAMNCLSSPNGPGSGTGTACGEKIYFLTNGVLYSEAVNLQRGVCNSIKLVPHVRSEKPNMCTNYIVEVLDMKRLAYIQMNAEDYTVEINPTTGFPVFTLKNVWNYITTGIDLIPHFKIRCS